MITKARKAQQEKSKINIDCTLCTLYNILLITMMMVVDGRHRVTREHTMIETTPTAMNGRGRRTTISTTQRPRRMTVATKTKR